MSSQHLSVGIVGCGTIGVELARFVDFHEGLRVAALCDADKHIVEALAAEVRGPEAQVLELDDLIARSDLIVEAANADVARRIIGHPKFDQPGKKLLVMSSSGLLESMDCVQLLRYCELFVPSGAIAGLDAIKAVAGRIRSLRLTTTKPPRALEGAPYVIDEGIELAAVQSPTTIFAGGLTEVVRGFPKNVNVAATLFLASRFSDIRVEVVADPAAATNIHEIVCEGEFGTITAKTANRPSANPKTSYLAVLSAQRLLTAMVERAHVGT